MKKGRKSWHLELEAGWAFRAAKKEIASGLASHEIISLQHWSPFFRNCQALMEEVCNDMLPCNLASLLRCRGDLYMRHSIMFVFQKQKRTWSIFCLQWALLMFTEVLGFWSLTLATMLGGKHEHIEHDKSYKIFASFFVDQSRSSRCPRVALACRMTSKHSNHDQVVKHKDTKSLSVFQDAILLLDRTYGTDEYPGHDRSDALTFGIFAVQRRRVTPLRFFEVLGRQPFIHSCWTLVLNKRGRHMRIIWW